MLSKYSVKKPFTIFVAVAIVLIFGVVSLYKMTPDLFPSLNAPVVIVMTTDPGASAEEAETEITEPLEQQLATLPNLDDISSVSADNYSYITLVFTDDVNMDAISVDIRDKVDQIKDQLPESAGSPVVMKINLDMMPVAVAAVSMKGMDAAGVSKLTRDELMTPLEGVEGVASVTAMGMIDDGLQIVLDQDKIDALNQKVRDAINSEINDGKRKVQKGINKAQSGESKVDSGKKEITKGEKESVKGIKKEKEKILKQKATLQARKTQLQAEKDKFLEQRDRLNEWEQLLMNVELLIEEGSIEEADEILKQIGFESVEQLQDFVQKLEEGDTSEIDDLIKMADDGIAQAEQALLIIDKEVGSVNVDLQNAYADLAAAASGLNITIAQLKQTKKEIEDSRDAALDGADLDNIITMDNVKSVLQAQNFSMPAGYVTDGEAEVLVSVGDKIQDAAEMEGLILFDLDIDDVEPIRVRDVGTVIPASEDDETYARVDGENGVLLSFTKQSTYATATVADNILDKFEELEKQHKGLKFSSMMNQGEYIHNVINSVMRNLILGAVLAILILLFFLRDIRPTVITAVSIPISVIFALALMYFSGITLNLISMSGLAIGVGMLVDNSIVVIENIYRLRGMGYSLVQSALSGAVQVAGAITASTLTTICVFLPIVFVKGTTRDVFTDLALTVTYSLVASLLIALTLAPAMAKGMLVRKPRNTVLGQNGRVIRKYRSIVHWSIHHKKWILMGALVLLLGSSAMLLSRGFEYMPPMASPQITAELTMPEDTTLKETARINDEIMDEVHKIDGVKTAGSMLTSDTASVFGFNSDDKSVTETSMYIVLENDKTENSQKVVDVLKKAEKKYDLTISTSADMDITSYMGGSDVEITLYSEDLDDLRESTEAIEDSMRDMKELEDVSDIDENRTEEVHITVDKNEAMEEGLTVAQVFQQVAAKLKKEETATTIKETGGNIDVKVENASTGFTRDELESMELTVDNKDGTKDKVKLTAIADISEDASLNQIGHTGQKRSATVTASVKKNYNITKVTSKIRKTVADQDLVSSGVRVEYKGQNEEIMDAMRQLLLMLIVGFLLVYLIMVAQFQSIRSPLIILFTIPLAFTGGMLALWICGQTLSVVSMMGFVMLMGIVVNNAIVLVDCINRFRLEGMEMEEAIIHSGAVRMRPVIMTAMTTVLGLVPMALGFGNGAEMIQPLAIVCIGGLLYATITTLLVVPVMYRLIGRKRMVKIEEEELEIVTV